MNTAVRDVLVESAGTDGAWVSLAVLEDHRLVIMKNGERTGMYETGDAGLSASVQHFLRLCGLGSAGAEKAMGRKKG